MLPSSEVLSRLLGALYDASTNSALWDAFLQKLAQSSGARAAALVVHDLLDDMQVVSRAWELDPEGLRLYQQYYGSIDVWVERGLSKPVGYVCTSQSLCPQHEIEKTEIYNDFLIRYGIDYGMFCVVERSPSCFASVSLYRDSSTHEFQESELDLLRFLTPHLRRAFRLHLEISKLQARANGFEAALEILPTAVIFLDIGGQVVLMNHAARQLMSENDGLFVIRNHLCAERPSESAELQKLITKAVATSTGKGQNPAGSLLVSRKNALPLHVFVSPVRGLNVDGVVSPCAAVFVNDPAKRVRPAEEILRQLFKLTAAECRLALLLADGRSPREISELVGISANTLKTQLSSIYTKTATSGQPALVRLLTQLAIRLPQSA